MTRKQHGKTKADAKMSTSFLHVTRGASVDPAKMKSKVLWTVVSICGNGRIQNEYATVCSFFTKTSRENLKFIEDDFSILLLKGSVLATACFFYALLIFFWGEMCFAACIVYVLLSLSINLPHTSWTPPTRALAPVMPKWPLRHRLESLMSLLYMAFEEKWHRGSVKDLVGLWALKN